MKRLDGFYNMEKRIPRQSSIIALLVIAIFAMIPAASAGCVTGSGVPIEGALVSLSPFSQYNNTSAPTTGCYNITDVPYGSYFMVTTHPSYAPNISAINVSSAEVTKDIQMKVYETAFSDIPNNFWAYPYVMYMKDNSITSGCGGGNYCPGGTIDRAMIAVFLVKALNLSYTPGLVPDFNDVPPSHWAYQFIMAAKQNGIINGANGYYNPQDPVTRGQLAVMITQGKHWSYSGITTTTFTDVPQDYWAYSFIMTVKEKYIISGYSIDNTFRPGDSITRDQAAVMISKMALWY